MTASNTKSALAPDDRIFEDLRSRALGGGTFAAALSAQMDERLRGLFSRFLTDAPDLCLMAVGGYGRAELCPHSDIDLMFLSQTEGQKEEDKAIEQVLYALWDKGVKIGYSVRSLKDCAELAAKDSKILTSLLDARVIAGNEGLADDLAAALKDVLTPEAKRRFVADKLEERDERHKRYGDTRYVLEPNIKEGKGGLRDFQTLMWIARVVYDAHTLDDLIRENVLTAAEGKRFSKSHEFLMTVRCHLHDIAGRAEERLHFDIQPDLAARLGYTSRHTGQSVERFMKHYFLVTRDIGDLTRILCAAIETDDDRHKAKNESFLGFDVLQGRLTFGSHQNLKTHPIDMLRLFRAAQENGRDIHPHALREMTRHIRHIDSVRDDSLANQIFLETLTSRKDAALILKRMNEAGLLGRFVPDFGRIIAMMQFDRYHHFTVDEHTLHCIDIMNQMERGELKDVAPIASEIAVNVIERNALYAALFLHDICKGRGGRHAELGAELAISLGPRFGLTGSETDLVSWLVHDHLVMSDTAFKRNLNDPKTIADFSAKMRLPERLDLLFILTTADIMGVGPGRWTAWKARLLEELYLKTRALMQGEEPGMTGEVEIPADMKDGETRVTIDTDERQSATVVIVYTPDRAGLFATLCGALSAEGANIMRAHIATVSRKPGSPKIAVDRFVIQNPSGLPFTQERRQEDIRESILEALNGTIDIDARIAEHHIPLTKQDLVFDLPPKIRIHNDASGSDTVVEVETRDRHGLLFDIACVFRDLGLDLRAAKVNTQGLRAIDAFYIQTAKRKKLVDSKGQERLIETLKAKVAKA